MPATTPHVPRTPHSTPLGPPPVVPHAANSAQPHSGRPVLPCCVRHSTRCELPHDIERSLPAPLAQYVQRVQVSCHTSLARFLLVRCLAQVLLAPASIVPGMVLAESASPVPGTALAYMQSACQCAERTAERKSLTCYVEPHIRRYAECALTCYVEPQSTPHSESHSRWEAAIQTTLFTEHPAFS